MHVHHLGELRQPVPQPILQRMAQYIRHVQNEPLMLEAFKRTLQDALPYCSDQSRQQVDAIFKG